MANVTVSIIGKVSWWVRPMLKAVSVLARFGLNPNIDRISAFILKYGFSAKVI